MGLFDSIKNLGNSIIGTNTDNSTLHKDNTVKNITKIPLSVVRPDGETVGTVVDEVVKTDNSVQKKNYNQTTSQKDLDVLTESILKKCKKLGITFEDAKQLIFKEMNFSTEDYIKKSNDTKFRILSCIDAALNLQMLYTSDNKFAKGVDKTVYLAKVATNYYDLIMNGGIEDIKNFQKNINNVADNSYNELKKAGTDKEKAEILDSTKNSVNNEIETEYKAKQRGKNKAEIQRLEEEKSRRKLYQTRALEYEYYARASKSERKLAVYLRDGKDLAESVQNAIDFSVEEEKKDVAVSQSYDYFNSVKQFKYEHGDSVQSDVYGNAVACSMQYKPYEAVQEFEADAYEFRRKVENGEIEAPWMSDDDFTAESTAIGIGITNNKYMSTAEKAAALNDWDNHIHEFKDYSKIKTAYNEAIQKIASGNEHNAQGIKNIKTILKENYDNDIENLPKAWEKRNEKVSNIKPKASEATLKTELKTKTVAEVKQFYSNNMQELARIILSNDIEYKERIDDIINYLKGYSGTDIGFMVTGCTTKTISKIIQAFPERAKDILDIVAPTMCFSGKQRVEQIVDEGKKNEAA